MSNILIAFFALFGLTWYKNVKGIIQTFGVTLVGRKLGLLGRMLLSQHSVDIEPPEDWDVQKYSNFGFKRWDFQIDVLTYSKCIPLRFDVIHYWLNKVTGGKDVLEWIIRDKEHKITNLTGIKLQQKLEVFIEVKKRVCLFVCLFFI